MANKFNMGQVLQNLQKIKKDLPLVLSNDALKFFNDSFKKQGWDDNGITKWKKRKTKKDNAGRGILIKSGALRRSIKIKEANFNRIIISSNMPYSKIHNEGFKGKENVKAHTRRVFGKVKVSSVSTRKTRKVQAVIGVQQIDAHTRQMDMPKRQFMGNSRTLQTIQIKKIEKIIISCFK